MKISKKLGISDKNIDFYDYEFEVDNEVFFDPFFIQQLSNSKEYDEATIFNSYIENFWTKFIDTISKDVDDALSMLSNIKEINYTCMGYSKGEPAGNSIGEKLRTRINDDILFKKLLVEGKLIHIDDIKFALDYVDRDRVSDIVTSIILLPLVEYTQKICTKYGKQAFLKDCKITYWNERTSNWERGSQKLIFIDNKYYLLYPKSLFARKNLYGKYTFFESYIIKAFKERYLKRTDTIEKPKERKNHDKYLTNKQVRNEIEYEVRKRKLKDKKELILLSIFEKNYIKEFRKEQTKKFKKIRSIYDRNN